MVQYNKALFLYNGNAGSNDVEQKLMQTLPVLTQAIKELTIIQTTSIKEAKQYCMEFASSVELIIILGGDGTVHECINSVADVDKRPIIAILPGGTCNDFSRMLEIPQNLKRAAEVIVNGEVAPIDLGKTEDHYFINFWGIGLITETSLNIDKNQKKSLGVLSYVVSTIKTVNQAEPFSFKINTESETYTGDAVMILILNGRFIGTKSVPIDSINPSDGKLDVLIVKTRGLATFKELFAVNSPNSNSDNDKWKELIYFQTKKLIIHTEASKNSDMDGEITGVTPSEIAILPSHIQMIKGPATV